MTKLDDSLIYEVLSAVNEIPAGKVASYGEIAKLTGHNRNARLVGRIMHLADQFGNYPCHRVVNAAGRLVPGWSEQRKLLEKEGVKFKDNGNVDMKNFAWHPF